MPARQAVVMMRYPSASTGESTGWANVPSCRSSSCRYEPSVPISGRDRIRQEVWRSRSLGSSSEAVKASSRKGCLLGLRKISSRLEEAMVADLGGAGIWHGGEDVEDRNRRGTVGFSYCYMDHLLQRLLDLYALLMSLAAGTTVSPMYKM
jgi:hypothetical protein